MTGRLAAWAVGLAAAGVVAVSPSSAARMPVVSSAQVADTAFRHEDHERVSCLSCHSMAGAHGELRVRSLADCRACHHSEPLVRDCSACHTAADVPAATLALPRSLALSVGATPARELPFDHGDHASVSCATCHVEGPALSARNVQCAACHVDHHRPEARCASCHVGVLGPPHTVQVHVGCAGAACHQEPPFEGVPRTRALCLACHQGMEAHRPGESCATCHLLPPPHGGPG